MEAEVPTERWSQTRRLWFFGKIGVIVAPTVTVLVAVLTLFLVPCGGVKAIGGQTVEKTEQQLKDLEQKMEARRKETEDRLTLQRIESEQRQNDGLVEVKNSIDKLSERIDRVLDGRQRRIP
jgi:hypothetical protein